MFGLSRLRDRRARLPAFLASAPLPLPPLLLLLLISLMLIGSATASPGNVAGSSSGANSSSCDIPAVLQALAGKASDLCAWRLPRRLLAIAFACFARTSLRCTSSVGGHSNLSL
jgi:hypothetical protein